MKKLFSFFAAIIVSASQLFSQPVEDHGVIPVAVSLTSILRLNIVSGGNIEFVVNKMSQYTNGIPNSALYDTRFTVSSSSDFNVNMYAEDISLIGADNPANTMALNNIGYLLTETGSGADPANWTLTSALTALTNASVSIVNGTIGAAAGDASKNDFTINWELATPGVVGLAGSSGTLLSQSLLSDRYTTNVFLVLVAK